MASLDERLQRMRKTPQPRKRGQVSREDVAIAQQYQRHFVHVGTSFNTDAIPDYTESLEQMQRDMRAAREQRDMMWEDHMMTQLVDANKQLVAGKAKKLAQETAMLAQLKTDKDKWLMAIELRLTEYLSASLSAVNTATRTLFFTTINASNGQTPLHRACRTNDTVLMTLLLALGADLTVTDEAGKTIFHCMAEHNQLALFRLLMQQLSPVDAHVLLTLDRAGHSVLHVAAESGSDELLALLLSGPYAANLQTLVNVQTIRERETALHVAARRGHTRCAALLLHMPGVSASIRSVSGSNALHVALQQTFAIDALVGVFIDPSCCAADLDELFQSLDDRTGRTCLHTAIIQHFRGVTLALLQTKRVQLNTATRAGGWSALHLAVMTEAIESVKALLAAGAMVDAVDADGQTPLLQACLGGNLGLVRLLLDAGANPAHQNKQAHSALHYLAAFCRDRQLLIDLLERGADVNAKSLKLNTPLHFAAMNGNDVAAHVLLAHGASASAINEDKRSVVYLAKKWRHRAVEELVTPPEQSTSGDPHSRSSKQLPSSVSTPTSSHAARAFVAQQLQSIAQHQRMPTRAPLSARSEDSDTGACFDFDDEEILASSTPWPIEGRNNDALQSQSQSQSFRELRERFMALALTPHQHNATLRPVVRRHDKMHEQERDTTTLAPAAALLQELPSPSKMRMSRFTRKFLAGPVRIPWDMTVPVPSSSYTSSSIDSTATAVESLQRKLKPCIRTNIGRIRDHLAHAQALSWPQHAHHSAFRTSSLKYQAPPLSLRLTHASAPAL